MIGSFIKRIHPLTSYIMGNTVGGSLGGEEPPVDYFIFNESAFQNVLEVTGAKEKFNNKEIICPECHSVVEWENLRAIIPNNETFDFMCDNRTCYDKYFYRRDNGG